MGGARTGPDGEPDAVVDAHCRVRGVANLRVVDLSVTSVRLRFASTLGVMLLGKHTAGWIAEGRRPLADTARWDRVGFAESPGQCWERVLASRHRQFLPF